MEQVKVKQGLPILIPYEPHQFWEQVRKIIREEIKEFENSAAFTGLRGVPGQMHKPLYKVSDLCAFFHVSKPTIYEWCKVGRIRPYKIGTRTYFLYEDVQKLLKPTTAIGYIVK
jgi:excisionase family DNA binding protein